MSSGASSVAWMTAVEVHQKYGPSRLIDADGEIVLGRIVEVNLATGEYVLMRLEDRGRLIFGPGGHIEHEKCQGKGPMRLIPVEGR